MNSSHPFEFVSPALSDAFRAAGWIPGVSRREAALRHYQSVWRNLLGLGGGRSDEDPYCDPFYVDQQFEVFPTAQVILDQLWGIKVTLPRNGRVFAETVYFSLNLVSGYEEEIRRLSRLLKTDLVPIGQRLSREIILISPEEYVFSLSFVAYGVTCDGRGFGNAIERILQGRSSQPLFISRDLDQHGLFEGDFNEEVCGAPIRVNGVDDWTAQVVCHE